MLNIRHRLTKAPLPLYFVDLEPHDNNKSIYDLQFLCNMKITVEAPRRKTSIVQCTRCQSYGHTKTYCTHLFACVKCGWDHNTAECNKDPATPATCALCGGAHPANYKGCDVYHRLQTARGASTPPSATPYSSYSHSTRQHWRRPPLSSPTPHSTPCTTPQTTFCLVFPCHRPRSPAC